MYEKDINRYYLIVDNIEISEIDKPCLHYKLTLTLVETVDSLVYHFQLHFVLDVLC